MKKEKVVETKSDLSRKLKEALAGQAYVYHYAQLEVENLSIEKLIGSGVVLEITTLGGRVGVKPVLIRDGLSEETINAIKTDLKRSYDLAIAPKPKG